MTTPLLATPDDVERYISTAGTVSVGAAIDPELIASMLAAASRRMIRARPDRILVPTPASIDEDPVELRFPAAAVVRIPDLREAVEVRLDGMDPLSSSAYTLTRRPTEETALWITLHDGRHLFARELVIRGQWGPSEVDDDVREACIAWVARVFHQRTARFADNTATPDGGVLGYFRNLPPDVKVTLDALLIPGV